MRTVTDHPATETVPGDDFEAGLDARRAIRVPFFEIGPKNMLRRPELHKLLAVAQSHSQQYGVSLIATLPVTEIEPASLLFPDIHLFAQHMDPDMPGPSVGRVIAEALADAGANGVLLNHADHQMPLDQVAVAVDRAKANGLLTLACAADEREAASIAALSPDILLYEPRAMIGHSGGARRPWIPQINALVRPYCTSHAHHARGRSRDTRGCSQRHQGWCDGNRRDERDRQRARPQRDNRRIPECSKGGLGRHAKSPRQRSCC